MRLAIATDAWFPQVNGVVRTLTATLAELARRGIAPELITPAQFRTVPMPGYPAIRLALAPRRGMRRRLDAYRPDIVHIETEGPIGWAARGWCRAHQVPLTTAFHTRFADYAAVRTGLSPDCFWPLLARFHAPARAILAATTTLADELARRGIGPVLPWSRGVDTALFRPDGPVHPALIGLPRPILLSVGRIAPEKNLAAFLAADVAGTRVLVGDGPARAQLAARFPQARFLGELSGEPLAAAYRGADCFVFPSLTDTFGLVVLEALACGVPVAAYPVPGPRDILGPDGRGTAGDLARPAGALDADLAQAITRALELERTAALALGARFTWVRATDQFLAAVTP